MNKIRFITEPLVAVVTAYGDYNPLQNLKSIGDELQVAGFKGVVVFDLLSCNGLSSNRFVKLFYDGSKFDRSTFCVVNNVDKNLLNQQDEFFRAHPQLLISSVLSRTEVDHFLDCA